MDNPIFTTNPADDRLHPFYSPEANHFAFSSDPKHNSHHSSPASASTSGASTTDDSIGGSHPRTPSPPDLTTPLDLNAFNLAAFDPTLQLPDDGLNGLVNWDNFDADWGKLLQGQQHMLPTNRNSLPKQEHDQYSSQQLNMATFQPPDDDQFVFSSQLDAFDFSAAYPGAPSSSNSDMRFPLSAYSDPGRQQSVTSSTSATHASPPSAQPLSAQSQSQHSQSGYSLPGSGPSQGQPQVTPPSAVSNLKSSQSPPSIPTVSFTLPSGAQASQPGQLPKNPTKRRLTPHNTIERRYRRNLNSCIQALRDAVPAVAILDRERWGDRWVPDDRGYVDGVRRAGKNSKSVVLEKGVEYIGVLNRRATRLARERTALQALLCSFPQGQMLFTQWEHTFLPMDRHLYGADELFRIPPGIPLAEAGITTEDQLLAAGAEEDEEDGEDWDEDGDDEDDGGRKGKKQRLSVGEADASGMLVPPPPPMSGGDAERRKRGRPRKNTQPSPPQQIPSPQAIKTSPPAMTRLSPEQQAHQMATRMQQQQLQMQQFALQQRQQQHMQQMAAMQQQHLQQVQSQLHQGGPAASAARAFVQPQQQQQQQQNGAGQAPRYLLAAFLCFSVFRTGGPFGSASTEPETHTGTVLSPAWASHALRAPASVPWLGVHSWLDVAQLAVMLTLCASLWFGGAMGWARPRGQKAVTKDEKTDLAERAILRQRGTLSRAYAIFSLLPSVLFPSSVEERSLLALLLPEWPLLRSMAGSLWNGASADIAEEEDASGFVDPILRAAFQLDLGDARGVIRRATVSKVAASSPESRVFSVLARAAVQQHITERATSRFISVANAAFRPNAIVPEDVDGDLALWAEQAALQLGGDSKALVEMWDDLEFGVEVEGETDKFSGSKQDDARVMLDALALLYSYLSGPEDEESGAVTPKASDALRLQLRRTLGSKTFDSSLRLADARDRVVDLLDPRRRR